MNNKPNLSNETKEFFKRNKVKLIAVGSAVVIATAGIASCNNHYHKNNNNDYLTSTYEPNEDNIKDNNVTPDKDNKENISNETEDNILSTTPNEEETNNNQDIITQSSDNDNNKSNENKNTNTKDKKTSQEQTKSPENNKPANDKKPEPQIGEPIQHHHKYSNWESLDDNNEQRVCSCGKKELRQHTYKETKKYNVSNNNGTYNEVTEYLCQTCNHKKTTSITKTCVFGSWHYNKDTKQDERVCQVTGYIETRNHIHTKGPDTYYEKVNDIMKEYTICPDCNEKVYSDHNHTLDTFVRFDENNEYYTCVCGEEVTNSHSLDNGTLDTKTYDTIYKCTNPECDYEKVEKHTHNFVISDWNETNENLTCICGTTSTRSHALKREIKEDPSGQRITTDTCTNDGCGYSKSESHIHVYSEVAEYTRTEDICQTITTKCRDCGHVKGIRTTEHVFTPGIPNCRICGYEKTEAINHIENMTYPQEVVMARPKKLTLTQKRIIPNTSI